MPDKISSDLTVGLDCASERWLCVDLYFGAQMFNFAPGTPLPSALVQTQAVDLYRRVGSH